MCGFFEGRTIKCKVHFTLTVSYQTEIIRRSLNGSHHNTPTSYCFLHEQRENHFACYYLYVSKTNSSVHCWIDCHFFACPSEGCLLATFHITGWHDQEISLSVRDDLVTKLFLNTASIQEMNDLTAETIILLMSFYSTAALVASGGPW